MSDVTRVLNAINQGDPKTAGELLPLVYADWQIAQLDRYNANIAPTSEKLGMQLLPPGTHTLRFECAGKSARSAGYFLGFDALVENIPVYGRPPNVDLRTLQKHK